MAVQMISQEKNNVWPRTCSLSAHFETNSRKSFYEDIRIMMGSQFGNHSQDITEPKDGPNDPEIHQVQIRAGESKLQDYFGNVGALSQMITIWHSMDFQAFESFISLLFDFWKRKLIRWTIRYIRRGLSLKIRLVSSIKSVWKEGKKDANAPGVNEVIDQELVLELRESLKQYDVKKIHGSWTSFLG